MPAFLYQSVLLHTLSEGEGWVIVGVKHNRTREIIATVSAQAGEWLAERWADMASQNLAGKPSAEID